MSALRLDPVRLDFIVERLAPNAETLGGFEPFLREYLFQCLTIGYPEAPMEQEVISLTARICGSPE